MRKSGSTLTTSFRYIQKSEGGDIKGSKIREARAAIAHRMYSYISLRIRVMHRITSIRGLTERESCSARYISVRVIRV